MPTHRFLSLTAAAVLAAAAAAQDPADDVRQLATALNQFGKKLHDQLAPHGAPTCSPASLGLALLMVLPGARGATAAEIEKTLSLPDRLRGERLLTAARNLQQALRPREEGMREEGMHVQLVNDLWLQQDFALLPDYQKQLIDGFDTSTHTVDFVGDGERARQRINAAVAAATNQRIPDLVPADLIDADTRLVLTNALWLRGGWRHEFAAKGTAPAPFTRADGSAVEVPLMRIQNQFAYAETARWQCVRMMFADAAFACDLILPAADTSPDAALGELVGGAAPGALTMETVRIELPRYRVAGGFRLRDALTALGMRTSFTSAADFSGMRAERDLQIADVVHRAWIAVDEVGAEAAAATAVVAKRLGAPQPKEPKVFRADRPFGFVMRHVPTGLVLFAGRVDDPSTPPQ